MGIDLVDIGMNVEREFEIQNPSEELMRVREVGDVSQLVSLAIERAQCDAKVASSNEGLLQRLYPIISRVLFVEPELVVPEARLVEDLGCE
jgi:hypothetical protein